MINLKTFVNYDNRYYKFYQDILEEAIIQGIIYNELIDVRGVRNIGKTTVLINFAKKNNIPVIVHSKSLAKILQDKFEYENIFITNEIKGVHFREFLIEEYVNRNEIEKLGYRVITGYYSE